MLLPSHETNVIFFSSDTSCLLRLRHMLSSSAETYVVVFSLDTFRLLLLRHMSSSSDETYNVLVNWNICHLSQERWMSSLSDETHVVFLRWYICRHTQEKLFYFLLFSSFLNNISPRSVAHLKDVLSSDQVTVARRVKTLNSSYSSGGGGRRGRTPPGRCLLGTPWPTPSSTSPRGPRYSNWQFSTLHRWGKYIWARSIAVKWERLGKGETRCVRLTRLSPGLVGGLTCYTGEKLQPYRAE